MKVLRSATAAVLVATMAIAAWASPASAHDPAVITAKKAAIQPHTNQMTCALPLPAVCDPASKGNNAVVRVVVPDRLRPVHQVCVTFHFEGDLVDPGEIVAFLSGGGFVNEGPTSLAERTSCFDRENQPDQTRLFADGRQTMSVWMEEGSAYLASVDVVVTGHRP
jgi:hypothetical protein